MEHVDISIISQMALRVARGQAFYAMMGSTKQL